jgi:hypothetical protein
MLHTLPLGIKFIPKFLSINDEISVSQYHMSIYQTKMETVGAYHMHPPRSSSVDYNCPTRPSPDPPFDVVVVEHDDPICGPAQL